MKEENKGPESIFRTMAKALVGDVEVWGSKNGIMRKRKGRVEEESKKSRGRGKEELKKSRGRVEEELKNKMRTS
ncbi:unnamed protein product [Brachionus calyciflorus]|uniref:Uncharacterized protein n=1 Tax=Brachionus calyciflorus TaxID=104777 RepID=A0A813SJX6_9BILA|nr:unnamed protein product [Brachionus calyciflorus]